MTVREKLEEMLTLKGMSKQQASEVMDLSIPEINADDYHVTFDSPSRDYPEIIYSALFVRIKPIALKWIEENKPQAWFKEIFN